MMQVPCLGATLKRQASRPHTTPVPTPLTSSPVAKAAPHQLAISVLLVKGHHPKPPIERASVVAEGNSLSSRKRRFWRRGWWRWGWMTVKELMDPKPPVQIEVGFLYLELR